MKLVVGLNRGVALRFIFFSGCVSDSIKISLMKMRARKIVVTNPDWNFTAWFLVSTPRTSTGFLFVSLPHQPSTLFLFLTASPLEKEW